MMTSTASLPSPYWNPVILWGNSFWANNDLIISNVWINISRGVLIRLLLAGVSSACPCRRNQWWWRLPIRTGPQGASWTPNRNSSGTLQQTFELKPWTWLPKDTAGLADGCGSLKVFLLQMCFTWQWLHVFLLPHAPYLKMSLVLFTVTQLDHCVCFKKHQQPLRCVSL